MMRLDIKAPDPVDIHVGERVRQRRKFLEMSQEDLGRLIGLTFQQVQKYERGANRISASKLFQISRALKTRISWFFDGYEDSDDIDVTAHDSDIAFENLVRVLIETPHGAELARAFPRIRGGNVRCRVVALVSALSED